MCAAQHTYHAWHNILSYPNCITVRLPVRISALVRLIQFRHCSKCCHLGYDSDICLLGFCFGAFFTWINRNAGMLFKKKILFFSHCWFTEETTSYSNSHVGQWATNSWYCTCDDAYTLIVNNSRESGSVSSFKYLGAIIPADQNSRRNQSKRTGYSSWKKRMM